MIIYTLVALVLIAGLQGVEKVAKSKNMDLNQKDWWKYVKSSVFTILIVAYTYFMEGRSFKVIRNVLVVGVYWLLQTVVTLTPDNLSWVPIKLDMSNISLAKDSLFGIYVIALLLLSSTSVGSIIG